MDPSPSSTAPLLSFHLEPPTLLSLLIVYRQTTTQTPTKDSMCMYLDVSVCVCVLSVNVWVLGVNVGESMCMSVYVRKSACERKQTIKQTGQMFKNRQIWVEGIWVFWVLVLFLHLYV